MEEKAPKDTTASDIALRPRVHPVIARMPKHLKDPANCEKIMRAAYDAFAGVCGTHSDLAEMANCARCQKALDGRAEILRKLGFESPAAFMVWRRIHEKIRTSAPLRMYNS